MNDLTDVSAWCGHWPFRALRPRDPGALKAYLQSHGVRRAWVSALESVLYPDPMDGNFPLVDAVAGDSFFAAIPIVDPSLALWRQDVEECLKRGAAKAMRLTPNYHEYALTDACADACCRWASERGLLVYVQLRMMDERTHHPLMKVPGVSVADLIALAARHPQVQFVAGAVYARDLARLRESPNLSVDLSLVESPLGLRQAVEALGPEKLLFGSQTPLIYYDANLQKMNPMPCDVPPRHLEGIRHGNADRLLSR